MDSNQTMKYIPDEIRLPLIMMLLFSLVLGLLFWVQSNVQQKALLQSNLAQLPEFMMTVRKELHLTGKDSQGTANIFAIFELLQPNIDFLAVIDASGHPLLTSQNEMENHSVKHVGKEFKSLYDNSKRNTVTPKIVVSDDKLRIRAWLPLRKMGQDIAVPGGSDILFMSLDLEVEYSRLYQRLSGEFVLLWLVFLSAMLVLMGLLRGRPVHPSPNWKNMLGQTANNRLCDFVDWVSAQMGKSARMTNIRINENSFEHFKSLLETTSDWLWEVDQNAVYTYVSPSCRQLLGYLPEELLGKTPFDLMAPEEAGRVMNGFKQIVDERGSFAGLENANLHKDGHTVVLETSGSPFYGSNGEYLGYHGIDRDITLRRQAEQALEVTEQRYRTLIDFAPEALLILDLSQMRFIDANANAEYLFGLKREQLLKIGPLDISPRVQSDGIDSYQKARKNLKEILLGGQVTFEWLHCNSRGEEFPCEVRLVRLPSKGKHMLVRGSIINISERKHAEVREAGLGRIIDESLNEIYVFAADTLKFIEVNRGARENIGYCTEELRQLTPLDLKPEFTLQSFNQLIKPLRDHEKEIIVFETVHKRKDNSFYNVEVHLQLISYQNQAAFAAFILDTTNRKKSKNALRKSEENLSITLNSIADAVIVINRERQIIRMNPVAEQLTGWEFAEAQMQPFSRIFNIIDTATKEPILNLLGNVFAEGTSVTCSAMAALISRAGKERQITASAAPIIGEQGEISGVILVFHDVTEQYTIQKALRESNDRFAAFSSAMPDYGFILDEDGRYIEIYGSNQHILFKPIDEMRGRLITHVLPAAMAESVMTTLTKTLDSGQMQILEYELEGGEGKRLYEGRTAVMQTEVGEKRKVVWISRDISERKLTEQALQESERRFRLLFDQLPNIAVQGFDRNHTIFFWNKANEKLYGYSQSEAYGKKLENLIIPKQMVDEIKLSINNYLDQNVQIPAGERLLQRKDGTNIEVFSSHIKLNNLRGEPEIYCIDIDLTERKKAQAEIEQLAYYDVLTELPNRRLLLDRLSQEQSFAKRHHTISALLFLDLDYFKTLNDALGHPFGDALLRMVAARMLIQVREQDTVARLGGDEFVVLLKELDEDSQIAAGHAQLVAEKIQAALSQPYQIEHHEHFITASIGITLFPENGDSPDAILKQADTAMYRAKESGRNTVRFYHPSMQSAADERLVMEKDLRNALKKEQLALYYQPQVDCYGNIIGAEALLRWKHPHRGLVSPAEFIPVAEETGMIIPIGEWVVLSACRQLKIWMEQEYVGKFHLAINVSPKQFRMPNFVELIRQVIDNTGIDANWLTLELTEGVVIDNINDTIEKMHALKTLGVGFSIDDFGTGYSSLAYLKQLPLSQLKIDQTFVQDINQDKNDEIIVETIITMANLLGLDVIAEGVETQEHVRFLVDKGCNAYQGYYFSKPVPVEQFTHKLY